MVRAYQTSVRRQVKVGQSYGRYRVTTFAGRNSHGNLLWECTCACGNKRTVLGYNLLGSANPSCGCHKREITVARNTTHGLSHTPEYRVWRGMRQRCENPNNQDYKDYGGRGITVCDRWQSFENFLADMGRRPSPGHTIEREDNDGGYGPDNCVWATRSVQVRNRRNVNFYEYDGDYRTLPEIARLAGVPESTVRKRLQLGWDFHEAITPYQSS